MARTQHLPRVQRLIRLHEDLIRVLQGGDVADIERLAAAREEEFEALRALGDVPPDAPDADAVAEALQQLDALNDDLSGMLEGLREGLAERLRNLQKGRTSLAGYGRMASGTRRGNLLGRG